MAGWRGHSFFYAFKCPDCDNVSIDYPHGYELYFRCAFCLKCVSIDDKKIYRDCGVEPPPGLLRSMCIFLKYLIRRRRPIS
ncbi:MAG: hypothetical protein A2831_01890 [Candidatus Yanofskybacteria bacterium RIFCSPHIGHO2_01_FULL_44_17]|uniref:Uncharacterized protein n=1 Tax=Candidatus Yanofskybacteria bacterium RIFCSPHIGHO2_01_FULL_44_17 TaxID=1802668 RepID=A0A1F8EVA9_9BACT|nr:MAG: hypothetical protein A2831_01890 [Candidatus Yanofskybacteria bacterium RIFCSPHIGHO2_01_FULL_44_17]